LAHWFGLRPDDVDDLTYAEVGEFVRRLSTLPPVGSVFLVTRKG
jgi:hypothetical protein